MGDFVFPSNILHFRESLVSGLVVLASDGSLIATPPAMIATHGWKLHDRKTKEQAYVHVCMGS